MKKIILLLVGVAIFSGCTMISELKYSNLAAGHELYYSEEFLGLDSFPKIILWINENVEYKDESKDIWRNPEETLKRGYGDCDDFAILFINIAYYSMNIKCSLAAVSKSRQIVEGGLTDHACAYYMGNGYDKYNTDPIDNLAVGYLYSFDDIF